MPVMKNHAGRTYGRITLSAPVPGKSGYWAGTCACGTPVEKRVDNLRRPGDHSCGRCPVPPAPPDAALAERVRRLEEIVRRPGPEPRTTPTLAWQTGPLFRVAFDGEFWQVQSSSGRCLCWADTEGEAAFAARVYLGLTGRDLAVGSVPDTAWTLPEERREQIRREVTDAL